MRLIRLLAVALLVNLMALPALVPAQEEVPTEKEVKQAEGEPPVIPHKVSEKDSARKCLSCHRKGIKGAPVTPHPERKACTQCHVPAEGFSPGKGSPGR